MKEYLTPTCFIDSDHPDIISFASKNCNPDASDIDRAVALNLAVRDGIRYNPYNIDTARESMVASATLNRGDGYCVAKAVLLAACARSQGIPARLGFADVKNHLNTKRLKALMETDTFIYHGYTEMYLNGNWVKATPAFNLQLCNNFNVKPLDFDGINDSIFHPYDKNGNKHMEYVNDHGTFADLPWERIVKALVKAYPRYYKDLQLKKQSFSQDARDENS